MDINVDLEIAYYYLSIIFSVIATITSVLLFLSPIFQVQKLKAAKSTLGQASIPFVFMWLNCVLWVLYGIQLFMVSMLIVNSIGIALSSYYIFVFYLISNSRERIVLLFTLTFCFGVATWIGLYANHFVGPHIEVNIIPYLATTVCMIMFGSPLIVVVCNMIL